MTLRLTAVKNDDPDLPVLIESLDMPTMLCMMHVGGGRRMFTPQFWRDEAKFLVNLHGWNWTMDNADLLL